MESSRPGRLLSHRFVAGLTVEEALQVTANLNQQGFAVSMDSLGESVRDEQEAQRAAAVYHRLLDAIESQQLNANVSLKLTGIGLNLSQQIGCRLLKEVVSHAASIGNFVRIDMEDTPYTEVTLQMTETLHAEYPGSVGTVLQSYLYRTAHDTDRLLQQGIRIRLCKGAYKEGPDQAFPAKADVDANYRNLAERMVSSPVYCGLATHDEAIVEHVIRFCTEQGIAADRFEFQMLYGVRRDLQAALLARGYRVRVYLPFGTDWYPYFMRRLAERPANVLFIAKSLLHS